MVSQTGSRRWSPPPLIANPWLRWGLLVLAAVYLYFAISSLTIDPARIARGLSRSSRLFAGFLSPDFVTRWRQIERGIVESLVMTVVASAAGVVLSLPVGIGAARNVSVLPVYLVCRAFIAISRTFQEVMIAILFVVMIGFGPLAGMLTLTFSSVGFLAKLLAEKIEEIDPAPVEAIRATGGSWLQIINFAVQPQVIPRFVGLAIYRFDINLRESAIVGVVGAGGIGATLDTSFSRYDYRTASAILIVIIALVMVTELVSSVIRKKVQ